MQRRDPDVPPPWMDEYERSIRKKVHDANILTPGEWVYLVGVFGAARDLDEIVRKTESKS